MYEENVWFLKLRQLYRAGKATENTLNNAVIRGWISEDEKKKILEGDA